MEKYSEYIMEKVRGSLGLDEDDTSMDDYINSMSKMEVFGAVLQWEGIIGYEYAISGWIEEIFGISLEDIEED